MAEENVTPNYIQEIVYALFLKTCPSISDVEEFAEKKSMNFNTLRDFYYKKGRAGITTINEIMSHILELDDEKVKKIVDLVGEMQPLSECDKVWHSIDLPPNEKLYYAQVARAVYDIDREV